MDGGQRAGRGFTYKDFTKFLVSDGSNEGTTRRESAGTRRAWSAVNSERLALGPSEHVGGDTQPLPV